MCWVIVWYLQGGGSVRSETQPPGPKRNGPGGSTGKTIKALAAGVLRDKKKKQEKVPDHKWEVPEVDERRLNGIVKVIGWDFGQRGALMAEVLYDDPPQQKLA